MLNLVYLLNSFNNHIKRLVYHTSNYTKSKYFLPATFLVFFKNLVYIKKELHKSEICFDSVEKNIDTI